MFSRTAEYALRAVVWLASQKGTAPIGAPRIAEGTQVPLTYLSKILQQLVKAGIVSSRRGVGGGFTLARDPAELSLFETVNAVDPLRRIQGCPLGLKTHRKALCPMHHELDEASRLVEEALSRAMVGDVLEAPSRPCPMVDSKGKR